MKYPTAIPAHWISKRRAQTIRAIIKNLGDGDVGMGWDRCESGRGRFWDAGGGL